MAPTSRIIMCRHSQAEHNVGLDDNIPDAPLTALGKQQSGALPPLIPDLQNEVDLIISSAMKRTLQSTKLGWGPAIERLGIKNVICLPQAQECNPFPCDTGSPKEHLESLDEFKDFNFELLTPDWNSNQGFYAADKVSLTNRAKWVRQYLRSRPEATIVLVAHGDILRRITCSADGDSDYQWKNAEVRIFEFDSKTVDREECYLHQRQNVSAAGGYARTSTSM
ncbi:phosphoglycerate mutase-like protein [Athelia psychrophila]|uniref:Phosphoglycerate mutase-like protein n=1 Tax=Athelia psychrophila TaxID=1759441 RepID=A0A166PUV5_9AGAM|nr:phosphoglycerate mutase-like protein [Fibularhizoctonia sp. CBS 109695]